MAQISVIGPSNPSDDVYQLSYRLGKIIGKSGHILITGGRGGVMEGASCGAKEAGGITVGILPLGTEMANKCVLIKIPTFINELRNFLVVSSADIVVSVGMSDGTLIELAIAHKMKKPIISFMLPEKFHFLSTHVMKSGELSKFETILKKYDR